jgi:hypothetical protein
MDEGGDEDDTQSSESVYIDLSSISTEEAAVSIEMHVRRIIMAYSYG